jgi:hypothetical protein
MGRFTKRALKSEIARRKEEESAATIISRDGPTVTRYTCGKEARWCDPESVHPQPQESHHSVPGGEWKRARAIADDWF